MELFITELIHLKEKKIIHKWGPKINKIKSYSEKKFISLKKYWISNPLLLKNGDLLIHGSETPLIKIDACSQLIWSLNYAFHHGIEKDHENNFWVPFTFYPESVDPGLDKRIGSFTKKFIDYQNRS